MSSRTTWRFDRAEAISADGMIAAKHPLAAEAGLQVLREGGNAIDAAVTAAFVAGVVEPFMSGIGGGGFLVAHFPATGEQVVVDHAMVAPRRATPAMFPLAGGLDAGMFGWPAVIDDANMTGHRAAAVPGAVAGLSLALERFGTITLDRALAPAIHWADEGFPVSWHSALMIGIDLALLNRYPATRSIFTADGYVPNPYPGFGGPLRQPDLARTLRAIAASGPDAFYHGAIAAAIATEMRRHGGLIDEIDLRDYAATIVAPLTTTYRGLDVLTSPTASGGPTVIETLNLLEGAPLAHLGHNSAAALHQIAASCLQAFADRLTDLADPVVVPVPIERLISKSYAAELRRSFDDMPDRSSVSPADLGRQSAPRMTTTHVSVIDRDRNSVSLTTTLLGSWGCGVVVPGTGIVLNNGMMWFDPVPGRPNSVAGGKKPLANMAPLLLLNGNHPVISLGAMGGRRILNALPQIIANVVDYRMGIQAAISAPRIDCATGVVQISDRIPAATRDALQAMGYQVENIAEDVLGFEFGSPAGVLAEGNRLLGGVNPYYPAMAIGL